MKDTQEIDDVPGGHLILSGRGPQVNQELDAILRLPHSQKRLSHAQKGKYHLITYHTLSFVRHMIQYMTLYLIYGPFVTKRMYIFKHGLIFKHSQSEAKLMPQRSN